MTQIFVEGGALVPVTVVEAGPCPVVQLKTKKRDGYEAAQIGFDEVDESRINSPMEGHFKRAKLAPHRRLAEVPIEGEMAEGQVLKADMFAEGDHVDVIGISKGKGFAGVMKRHGFSGGPGGHGSHFHRAPGSIGMAATPSRVLRGMKMAGQMGDARITVQNLEVVRVDAEQNLMMIKGAVPGGRNGVVLIKETTKTKR